MHRVGGGRTVRALRYPAARFSAVARALRDATPNSESLQLSGSRDLVCNNIFCEKVGRGCACRVALVISRLPQLKEIDLSSAALDVLPDSLWTAPQLRKIVASHNQLARLVLPASRPATTDQSAAPACTVAHLDLRHNRLRQLPAELFTRLPLLTTLLVQGNPLQPAALDALRQAAQQATVNRNAPVEVDVLQ